MTVSTAVARVADAVPRKTSWRGGIALLAVLLATGCDVQGEGGAPESGTSPSPSAAAAPSATPSPSTSPTPSSTQLTAADGKRYAACPDGKCEVAVAKPVRIRVNGGTVAVTRVKRDDRIDFELEGWDLGGVVFSHTLKGCETASLMILADGAGLKTSACDTGVPEWPGWEPAAVFQLQLAGWTADGAAVLRLVSG